MTPEQKRANARADYAKKKLDPEYMARKREKDRLAKQRELKSNPAKVRARANKWRDSNPDKIKQFNQASRKRIMESPELRERENSRKRIDNLTPEQIDTARARKRVENMTPVQIQGKRESARQYGKAKTREAREKGTTRYAETLTEKSRITQTKNQQNWRQANPDKTLDQARRHSATYREKWGAQHRIDNYAFKALRMALVTRDYKSKYFPGYTGKQFKTHIFDQLEKLGWTLMDYAEIWEIDHIVPITAFRYESIDDDQYKECWALENLQPLCKIENRSKGGIRN